MNLIKFDKNLIYKFLFQIPRSRKEKHLMDANQLIMNLECIYIYIFIKTYQLYVIYHKLLQKLVYHQELKYMFVCLFIY